jgi:hypothetical protein
MDDKRRTPERVRLFRKEQPRDRKIVLSARLDRNLARRVLFRGGCIKLKRIPPSNAIPNYQNRFKEKVPEPRASPEKKTFRTRVRKGVIVSLKFMKN